MAKKKASSRKKAAPKKTAKKVKPAAKKRAAPAKKRATPRKRAAAPASQLTLRDYQPSPAQYDLPQGSTQITVQANLTLSGNDSPDTLVIKFGQPNSANWQLTGSTRFQKGVNRAGHQNISFPISFGLKPGRSRVSGEHFLVRTTASLRSNPDAPIVSDIQVDVS